MDDRHYVESGSSNRDNVKTLISKTYMRVASGVFVTAVVSFLSSIFLKGFISNFSIGVSFVSMLLLFGALMFANVRIQRAIQARKPKQALGFYYGVTAVFGLFMTIPFSYYSINSIAAAFLMSAAIFMILAKYGVSTNRNFISWGRTLFILLIASVVVSLISFFFNFGPFQMVINILIMLLFSVYIIYDSNRLVRQFQDIEAEDVDGVSVGMAMSLYMDFINLFQRVLNIIGSRN